MTQNRRFAVLQEETGEFWEEEVQIIVSKFKAASLDKQLLVDKSQLVWLRLHTGQTIGITVLALS
jgi:hypothetical protein